MYKIKFLKLALLIAAAFCLPGTGLSQVKRSNPPHQYRLLATTKTSSMEKEMNQAAEGGFRYKGVMGGETSFGGSEVVTVMEKLPQAKSDSRYQYKLLATSKTSTMQDEIQQAGNEGFEYSGQTVFESAFGGQEVVIILERDTTIKNRPRYEYRLLATKKTSTMQKEVQEAADEGFTFVGVTVSKTKFAGNEIITIMRRVDKN
jgi:hypothetical protein